MTSYGILEQNNYSNDNMFSFTSLNTKILKKGDILYDQGENAKISYMILEGAVESVSILKENRESAEIRLLKKGQILGLIDIILESTYSRTMRAKTNCIFAEIEKDDIKNILKKESLVASIILKSLAITIENHCPGYWS